VHTCQRPTHVGGFTSRRLRCSLEAERAVADKRQIGRELERGAKFWAKVHGTYAIYVYIYLTCTWSFGLLLIAPVTTSERARV